MATAHVSACVLAIVLVIAAVNGEKSRREKFIEAKKACKQEAASDAELDYAACLRGKNVDETFLAAFTEAGREQDAGGEVLKVLKNCASDETKESCLAKMKEKLAELKDVEISEIDDDMPCAVAKAGFVHKHLKEADQDCAGTAKAAMPAIMKQGAMICTEGTADDTAAMLCTDAFSAKVKEVCSSCEETAACDTQLVEAKTKFNRDVPIEKLKEQAGANKLREGAIGCARAKKDDVEFKCDGLDDLAGCGPMEELGATIDDKMRNVRVRGNAARDMAEELIVGCFKKESKADKEKCFSDQKQTFVSQGEELVGSRSKVESNWDEIVILQAGKKDKECEGVASSERDACHDGVKDALKAAKLENALGEAKKRHIMGSMSEVVEECDGDAECKLRDKLMQRHTAEGGKSRELLTDLDLAGIEAGGQVVSECEEALMMDKEDGVELTADEKKDCKAKGREKFFELTGRTEMDDDTERQVNEMARAKMNGLGTRIVKYLRLAVAMDTDSAECSTPILEKAKQKVEQVAEEAGITASAEAGSCSKVAEFIQYSLKLLPSKEGDKTVEKLNELADRLAEIAGTSLDERRLGGGRRRFTRRLVEGTSLDERRLNGGNRRRGSRRLVQVASTYASQDTALCVEDDDDCQNGGESNAPTSSTDTDLASRSFVAGFLAPVMAGVSLAQMVA
eukprot:CAMPEP_0171057506 /NCGR_PEP_ID=MMETSP0766_2-20121228/1855_1 /TAXON_ID=439317 /ORGANISM="Gambierdiscus australes, Strain CAWD 149" /LENGTH=681 /DNA_ID=CAMNT_0011512643 /DNA_START=57 /DNA_END=2102 /DNA_ORIENTATION=-